ncbi:hypothetical protein WJX72_001399 [[Myrmecia] bisecta]|uniref:NADH:ubiquinone oxidoreductase intermediate-associated protein 30 domain-containing protein n=1 Tax=[Myrmecia] bisecta TaxID=41462 RepID=A0AAW1NYZ8_9CHLO
MIWRRLVRNTQDFIQKVKDPYPPSSRQLFRFKSPEDLAAWNIFTDQEFGGLSTASLSSSAAYPGTANFAGEYSTELGVDAGDRIRRSGFAGIRSQETGEHIDLEPFDHLVFRVRGDGRKYIANIRTENWIVGDRSHDIWQAYLFARKGVWQDVRVPLDRFLLTWKGKLVETEVEMARQRVLSLGISLAGGEDLQPHGPFCLGLENIHAERVGPLK